MTMNCNRKRRNQNRGFNGNLKKNKNHVRKRRIEDYLFYVGTSKQALDFEISSKFIMNYIKHTFKRGNDIVESLQIHSLQQTKQWKVKLEDSIATDKKKRDNKNKQFELEFKANLQEFIKRITTYAENLFKACAFLWEKCAKGMQNKIASREDLETRIYNHPINLLKSIKEHSLNYQETRYEMSSIIDSIRSFINAKQKENESLHNYTRHFKIC